MNPTVPFFLDKPQTVHWERFLNVRAPFTLQVRWRQRVSLRGSSRVPPPCCPLTSPTCRISVPGKTLWTNNKRQNSWFRQWRSCERSSNQPTTLWRDEFCKINWLWLIWGQIQSTYSLDNIQVIDSNWRMKIAGKTVLLHALDILQLHTETGCLTMFMSANKQL